MLLYFGLQLVLLLLSTRVHSAPLTTESMEESELQLAAEDADSLLSKIHRDIHTAHQAWIHTESLSLDKKDNTKLDYMKKSLNLPEASSLPPASSDKHTLEACLSAMAEGLRLHQTVLKVVGTLVHDKPEKVDGLLYDIRDLLIQLQKMQKLIGAVSTSLAPAVSESQLKADLAPRLKDEYMSQVAAHLALFHLRQFVEDSSRSLQSLTNSESLNVQQEVSTVTP